MKNDTPMHAIKMKCLDCVCGQYNEVRMCPSEDCALWPYRLGRRPEPGTEFIENPYSQRKATTEEQKAEAADRLRKMWEVKKSENQYQEDEG